MTDLRLRVMNKMRWLFVGEALVLRKEQRILVLLVLNQRSIKRSVGILGGETAKQHLPSAELRDGPRPSVLAFQNKLATLDYPLATARQGSGAAPYESARMRSMTTAKYACWAASLKNERSTNRLIASNALTAALSSFVIRVGGMFKRCPNTSKSTRR